MRRLTSLMALVLVAAAARGDSGPGVPRGDRDAPGVHESPRDLRDGALRVWALGLCATLPHTVAESAALQRAARSKRGEPAAGPSREQVCTDEVARRFDDCAPPFLAHQTEPRAFVACLGFVLPPEPSPPRTLAECPSPSLRLRFSIAPAKPAAWQGAAPRTFGERTLFVAAPILDQRDVERARLEQHGDHRVVVLEIGEVAAARLLRATSSLVGDWMIVTIEGRESPTLLQSPVGSRRLTLSADGVEPAAFCRAR